MVVAVPVPPTTAQWGAQLQAKLCWQQEEEKALQEEQFLLGNAVLLKSNAFVGARRKLLTGKEIRATHFDLQRAFYIFFFQSNFNELLDLVLTSLLGLISFQSCEGASCCFPHRPLAPCAVLHQLHPRQPPAAVLLLAQQTQSPSIQASENLLWEILDDFGDESTLQSATVSEQFESAVQSCFNPASQRAVMNICRRQFIRSFTCAGDF